MAEATPSVQIRPYNQFEGLPISGGMSERLWNNTQQEVLEALHHPFVTSLALGTLDRCCFQHYILQDAFFLSYFAKAYAAALDKCNGPQHSHTKVVLSKLLLGVHTELQLHSSYAAQWGVSVSEVLQPSAATAAYTDYLMEVANDPEASVAEILAAMIPCSRLYGYLGCQLSAATAGLPEHAYSEWVKTYSSAEYLAGPVAKEECFDKLCEAGTVSYDRLKQLYTRAMQLELNFFSAQPGLPSSRRIGLFICDFDETCTEQDTIGVLMNAAVEAKVKACSASQGSTAAEQLKQLLSAQVKQLADNYIAKQQLLLAQILPPDPTPAAAVVAHSSMAVATGPTASAAAAAAGDNAAIGAAAAPRRYDAAGLAGFCQQLSDFDIAMNQVVVDSDCLAGLTADDIKRAATRVQLQPGCRQVLVDAAAAHIPVAVLSVNWSKTLVSSVLAPTAMAAAAPTPGTAAAIPPAAAVDGSEQQQQGQQQQQQDQSIHVHANELIWGPDGTATGDIEWEVQCGTDKHTAMNKLLQQYLHSRSCSASTDTAAPVGAAVYVGDSTSDILPLLKADCGIIIGHNKLLRRVLRTFGVRTQPLCSAPMVPVNRTSTGGSSSNNVAIGNGSSSAQHNAAFAPVLYEAASWHEISAFLFGPSSYSTHTDRVAHGSINGSSAGNGTALCAAATTTGAAIASAAAAMATDVQVPAAAPAVAPAVATAANPSPVLTIAGSDSGGGAGIQADLKTIMANGGFGLSVLTAVTAQNTRGVQDVHTIPPAFLAQQLDSVLYDLKPAAIKTGMLPDAASVEVVADKLMQYIASLEQQGATAEGSPANHTDDDAGRDEQQKRQSNVQLPIVVDPVMISTSGHALAVGSVADALKRRLIPLAAVITPNLSEAEKLCGDGRPVQSVEDMETAAAELHKLGCKSVLLKGGHLAQLQHQQQQAAAAAVGLQQEEAAPQQLVQAIDVLYDGQQYHYFSAPYIQTGNTHGTGCTMASAIATALANGETLVQAVQTAKEYLTSVLVESVSLDLGAGPQHPFNHAAGFSRVAQQQQSANSDGTALATAASAAAMGPNSNSRNKRCKGFSPVQLRAYVVTDAGCNAKAGRTLLEAVTGAVAGGATIVQLREKDIDGGEFVQQAIQVIKLCRPRGIPVLINDRVDVALASGADGVHVGQSDIPARIVRQMLGPDKILGVSCKTRAEAAKALVDGADYIGVGAVFPTGTKASSVIGLEGLAEVCSLSALPAVAIGGVGVSNAADVIASGVDGLAVVSAVFAAPDVAVATRDLRQAVDKALEHRNRQQHQAVTATN